MAPLLDIQNLQVRFGATEAVRGISVHVDEGEVLGLVGESGSGKSATALAILGLLGPAAQVAGKILWNGSDLTRQSPREWRRIRGREIAMIFQEPMRILPPGPGAKRGRKPSKLWKLSTSTMPRGATATIRTSFPGARGKGS
jgi:ABC-type glutathione transport system ATPase component